VAEEPPPGQRQVPVRRVGAGAPHSHSATGTDWVAVEEPLEIRLVHGPAAARAEMALAVTMRTPGADEALVRGLLFAEGLITESADLLALTPADDAAQVLRAELRPGIVVAPERLSRHVLTGSSCGVCGKTAIAALAAQCPWPVPAAGISITAEQLGLLPDVLQGRQPNFSRTGGLHAAALFDASGQLLSVFEDVGRHNALDKLIGHALAAGQLPLAANGILVSSRASFEIVQKARMAGCPLLAAVGAPSSLAVELAWEADITLIGFLRDGRCNVYTVPRRVGAAGDSRQ